MMGPIFTLLAIGIFTPRALPNDNDPAKDREALQGTWKVVAIEAEGERDSGDFVRKLRRRIVIKGNRWTCWEELHIHFDGTMRIDSTKEPKWADYTLSRDYGGHTALAIYEIKGNSLQLCLENCKTSLNRPTAFTAEAGSTEMVITCQRTEGFFRDLVHHWQNRWKHWSGREK
jgi:uncharacterized protein (TIGR03067 family)